MVTGARNRYPRCASVSINRGFSAESPSASRSLLMAVPSEWSKSTIVSPPHSRCWISSRVTTSPGRSSRQTSTRNGCACSRIRIPDLRSSPDSCPPQTIQSGIAMSAFSECSTGTAISGPWDSTCIAIHCRRQTRVLSCPRVETAPHPAEMPRLSPVIQI